MIGRVLANPALVRVGLTAVVIVDLCSFYLFIGEARATALADGRTLTWLQDTMTLAPVRGAVVLVGVAGAIAFGRRPGRLYDGLVALGALTVLSTVHTQLFGSPWRHLFFSGLCLSGWLLGLAVRRYHGAPTDESYARMGGLAFLAAAYLNSGISKIVFGGAMWLSGVPIQAAVLGQSGLLAHGLAGRYQQWVVTTPVAAGVLSVATVAFELAGPLMLIGGAPRLCVALGLLGMHLNIYVLTTHILYWESIVLLILFGFSADVPTVQTAPERNASRRAVDRRFVAAVALLTVFAVLAIGHQARRSAARAVPDVAPDDQRPVPTWAPLRQIGPFALGQRLAGSWSVDALELRGEGFTVSLTGTPGAARFEFTCAAQGSSPFDIGEAHILYPSDRAVEEIEDLGRALQARVREASEGREVCERLQAWRLAAQAEQPR